MSLSFILEESSICVYLNFLEIAKSQRKVEGNNLMKEDEEKQQGRIFKKTQKEMKSFSEEEKW